MNLMGKEHLDIHIYSDKISLEIFSNDYQNNFSCNIYNVDDDQKNEMTAIGGDLMIESIRTACDIRACDSQGVAFVENRKCLL